MQAFARSTQSSDQKSPIGAYVSSENTSSQSRNEADEL
jgi:hypothetical protein